MPAPPMPRKRRPLRRLLSFGLHLMAGLMGLVVLLLGGLVLRLYQGPVRLDSINPHLEQALVDAGLPPLSIESTFVAWDPVRRRLGLAARNVRLRTSDGAGLVLPGVRVGLRPNDLVNGEIRPTDVSLTGLHVTLIRDRADRWRIPGLDAVAGEAPADGDPTAFLARLAAGETGLSALTSLRLEDAALTIEDRYRGKTWQAPHVDLRLMRRGRQLVATGMVELDLGGRPLTLQAEGRHELGLDRIALDLSFVNLRPARLAAIDPVLAGLTAVDLAIDGRLSAKFRRDGTLTAAQLEARMDEGRILLPGEGDPLPVKAGTVRLDLATPDRSIGLRSLRIDLGEIGRAHV